MGHISFKMDFSILRARSTLICQKILKLLSIKQVNKLRQALTKHIVRSHEDDPEDQVTNQGALLPPSLVTDQTDIVELVDFYVWNNDRMGRLGRPSSTVDDYF